ncbi:MAG: TfoX/Sxy family protein [Alphaproteobacteria bacterium]|nr:TfoX/Sxy family protein [Alphaproteobacteria bacterium]
MTANYVQELQTIINQLITDDGGLTAVDCKRFFNGAATYIDGKIFMTLTPVGLALKLPADVRTELMTKGAKPLQYFPKAPIKREYVIVPDKIAMDDAVLAPLVRKSINFVSGQAVKKMMADVRNRPPS